MLTARSVEAGDMYANAHTDATPKMKIELVPPRVVLNDYRLTLSPQEYDDLCVVLDHVIAANPSSHLTQRATFLRCLLNQPPS